MHTEQELEALAEQHQAEFDAWIAEHFVQAGHRYYQAKVSRTAEQWVEFLIASGMKCQLSEEPNTFTVDTSRSEEPSFFVFKQYNDGYSVYEPTEGMVIRLDGWMSYV